jgi:hypothetical protein
MFCKKGTRNGKGVACFVKKDTQDGKGVACFIELVKGGEKGIDLKKIINLSEIVLNV